MNDAYKTLLTNNTVLHPDTPESTHIRHHDIRRQTVSNDGDLPWLNGSDAGLIAQVLENLGPTARFLDSVL